MARAALRQGDLSLYRQVETILREQIADGELKPGERLPTEADLRSHYGVSRATVRQALDALERDGLIARYAGRGTFVRGGAAANAPARTVRPWREVIALASHAERVVRVGEAPAPAHVCALLGVAATVSVPFFIKSSAAAPRLGVKRYLHPRYKNVVADLAEASAPAPVFARRGLGELKLRQLWVESLLAEPRFALLLKVPPGSALLSLWWAEGVARRPAVVSQMLQPGGAGAVGILPERGA